jgi:hypothetical protein
MGRVRIRSGSITRGFYWSVAFPRRRACPACFCSRRFSSSPPSSSSPSRRSPPASSALSRLARRRSRSPSPAGPARSSWCRARCSTTSTTAAPSPVSPASAGDNPPSRRASARPWRGGGSSGIALAPAPFGATAPSRWPPSGAKRGAYSNNRALRPPGLVLRLWRGSLATGKS